ncbi:MAG: dTMP kinase [uncultured DHVE6 group euryarchaeote]|nr:MAG: dTMP kinase [uncultured DHVE6 group euryarchaeote]
MERGKLIVIDGTDGAGKETQTKLLEERLNAEGIHVIKYSFPNYDSIYGKMISQYLQGDFGKSTEVHPKLASILYALDRGMVADEMTGHLESGHYILCDRYIESNIAYQQAKLPEKEREEFFKWLTDLEHNELRVPVSDAVLFLRVPVDISRTNMDNREELDGHEENQNYQQEVLRSYEALAKDSDKWTIIDCTNNGEMCSREEIHKEIYQAIQ